MTTSSYQNSAPAELVTLEPIEDYDSKRKGRRFVLILGVAMALFVALVGSSSSSSDHGSLRAGNEVAMLQQQHSSSASLADAARADVNPAADQPQPDYNGEGRYDWQKCKASNDPDCWKNEGERVGSYWENFGQRMKAFWTSFRQSIHDFFVGKEAAADDGGEETATTSEKKTSKKKHKSKEKEDSATAPAAAAATSAPEEVPAAIPDTAPPVDDDKLDDD